MEDLAIFRQHSCLTQGWFNRREVGRGVAVHKLIGRIESDAADLKHGPTLPARYSSSFLRTWSQVTANFLTPIEVG